MTSSSASPPPGRGSALPRTEAVSTLCCVDDDAAAIAAASASAVAMYVAATATLAPVCKQAWTADTTVQGGGCHMTTHSLHALHAHGYDKLVYRCKCTWGVER